jgi:Ni/Co efflux regulator RcnB
MGELKMMKRIMIAALAAGFLAAFPAAPPSLAQDKKVEKSLSPQQQRMRDCAARWKEEKRVKNVSGRTAYRSFMRECLKKS